MMTYLGSVWLIILISGISGDLSKFYNNEEDAYEDYDYYEESPVGGYDDVVSRDKSQHGTDNVDEYNSNKTNRGRNSGAQGDRRTGGGDNGFTPEGGIDFNGCEDDPETGRCCITKEEQITTLTKDPILECTHKDYEQCHYTYVTQFRPSQQELCEETFDKQCSISFVQKATNDTVQKCYKPLVKVCGEGRSGQFGNRDSNFVDQQEEYGGKRRKLRFKKDTQGGKEKKCTTFFESSCTTRYVEKSPGKFVADTSCEKLPVELCGQGCGMEPGPEECHDKVVVSVVDVPEEVCDLNPVKSCRFATKLVPHLSPTHECTVVPKEVCVLKFSTPQQVQKPLLTKWCLDPTEPEPGESYDEENAKGSPIGPSGQASFNRETVIAAKNKATGSQRRLPTSSGFTEQRSLNNIYEAADRNHAATGTQLGYGNANNLDSYDPAEPSGDIYEAGNTYNGPRKSADDYGAPDASEENYAGGNDGAADNYGAPDAAGDIYSSPNTAAVIYGAPNSPVDTYSSPNTAADINSALDSVPDSYGAPNRAAENYGAPNTATDNNSAPNTLADNYGAPNAAVDNYGAPNPAVDNYGAPNTATDNHGAPNKAADNYGAPNTAADNYGAPNTAADNYGAPDTAADNYGAPNPAADNNGVPTTAADNYSTPNKAADDYGSPNSAADSNGAPNTASDNYGAANAAADNYNAPNTATDSYGAPNKAADIYGAPKEASVNIDYDDTHESLDTYKSSKDDSLLSNKNYGNPPIQDQPNYNDKEANQPEYGSPNSETNSVANYRIDNGFGTRNYYSEPTNDLGAYGNQNGLGRYLIPPKESRKSKSNQSLRKKKKRNRNQNRRRSKQSNTRIRSVDPYIYV